MEEFEQAVRDLACERLAQNHEIINDLEAKYQDLDGPQWQNLRKAIECDQELLSQQTELENKILKQERIIERQEIGLSFARNEEQYARNEAVTLQSKEELNDLKQSYNAVTTARQLVHKACPALDALDVTKIDADTSNKEIFTSMQAGFKKAHAHIDDSITAIKKGDVPLQELTPIIDEVRNDPHFDNIQADIDQWVDNHQAKETFSQVYWTAAEIGTTIFNPLAGIAIGIGTVYQDVKNANITASLARADEIGNRVLDGNTRENAEFDQYMAYAGVALTALDLGVVKSLPKTLKLSTDSLSLTSNFPNSKIIVTNDIVSKGVGPKTTTPLEYSKKPKPSDREYSLQNPYTNDLKELRKIGVNPLKTGRLRSEISKSPIGKQVLDAADKDSINLSTDASKISDKGLMGESIGKNGWAYIRNT
jgi:hypothetical protein